MYEWIAKITGDEGRFESLARLVALLPRPIVLAACQTLGWALYRFAGVVREQVKANMGELLGEASEARLYTCCRDFFRHGALALYEVLAAVAEPERLQEQPFAIEGLEHLETALSSGRGAILFTPHLGNFFYSYWALSRRYPCLTVGTAGSPELRPIYERFHQLGCPGLDYDATPPLELVRALRRHLQQRGLIFLLGDFWRPNFPPSLFFDRPTRSPGGTALLALDLETPVVPFYGHRIRGSEHCLVFCPPVYLHREFRPHQRTEATNRLNRLLAEMVAWVPEQWFYWFNVHERWEREGAL
ncbi:lipid A biosynthesis acyltransferase [Heliobacterium gestii]|uniref:Lipid A biosynthesis acyltransferase n=1 Tax=Heliomicrobium gestii TaxID=2699 RepID=A0A845LE45_HELGE|nr:lipid A biosynthesis acyltransferase [Heliomicrobium gestii]MBM7866519.1 KDO2-lipid IV(A) lauroyltransferase [Heliomicrobium gestii]MZP43200.1 lipid A biosynthesis acyltransferase [Heliomicrobium gestii]